MRYPFKTYFLFTVWLVINLLNINKGQAQPKIKLSNIAKVKLFAIGPVSYGGEWAIEVVPENNIWQRYQILKSDPFGQNRTKQRIYIDQADKNDLKALVKIVNKLDTALSIKSFKVDKKKLVKYIDSVSYRSQLPEAQRKPFARFLMSDDSLQKALKLWFKLSGHSDHSYKIIHIITNTNDTIKVYAKDSKPYCLPWSVNGKINYNLSIAALFTKITYGKSNTITADTEFYKALCKCAYMVCFNTNRILKFFWYTLPQPFGNFEEVKLPPNY